MHRDGTECVQCADLGYVIVPMLVTMDDGEILPFGTQGYKAVVRCGCGKGRSLANNPDLPITLSLERYEAINPGWRAQLKDRDRQIMLDLTAIREKKPAIEEF